MQGKLLPGLKKNFFKRQLYAKSKEKWQTEIKYFIYLYTLKQEKKRGTKIQSIFKNKGGNHNIYRIGK